MASLILGNIGSSLLGPIGGFIGSAIGSMIDQWLFAPKPEDIHGPRLDDLKSVSADPGKPIPLVYGADRIPGIILHTTDLIETVHKERVGGKGGPKQDVYSYTYHVDIDYLMSEGPILGVGRIWADGRLIRGTHYQMELDTEENFEKIGGIPYEDWYWDNHYEASEVPWTYDPEVIGTIGSQKYVWGSVDGFTPVSDQTAETILNKSKRVVYAYDSGTGKYLPIPESHAFTGERLKKAGGTELKQTITEGDYTTGPGTTNPNGVSVSIHTGAVNENDVNRDGIEDGTGLKTEETVLARWATLEVTASVYMLDDSSIWGDDYGFQHVVSSRLEYSDESEDGGGSDLAVGSYALSTPSADQAANRPVPIPQSDNSIIIADAEDHYDTIQYSVETARELTTFTHESTTTWKLVQNVLIRKEGPDLRDWNDYANFYDAINDWSPKAILQFHSSDYVALYPGHNDQPSDPVMEAWANEFNEGDCGVPAYIGRAHIVFQRLELEDFGNRIPNLTFEVVQSDEARIRPILEDLFERADVDPSLYDVSELPETGVSSYVLGYTIGNITSYRAAMEPLIDAFEVDASEVGDKIMFRPKRRAVDHTIDYIKLGTKTAGEEPQPPLRLAIRNEIEMPVALDVRFKDPEREYQPSTARYDRQVAPGRQRSVYEVPMVREPNRMKTFVRDKMRDIWLERISGSWTLPQEFSYISVSDYVSIINSPDDRYDFTFKVTNITRRTDGNLEMEGVRQDTRIYVPQEGETEDNGRNYDFRAQRVEALLPSTRYVLMDIPPLRPEDDNAGFYYALGGNSNAWPGGSLYREVGIASYEEVAFSLANARIGQVQRSQDFNKSKSLYDIDLESTVDVFLFNPEDTLESVADDLFYRGKNVAMIGKEIVSFQNATSLGDGKYRLDTFVRAMLDTEDHANEHTDGESFVLLDPDEIGNLVDPEHGLGVSYNYGSVTLGDTDPAPWEDRRNFENRGERLKPFRPVMLDVEWDVSGDATISWVRQNRLNFWMNNGPNEAGFPNSEDFEKYILEIHSTAVLPGTVIREVEVVDATEFVYTDAMKTEDGWSSGETIYISVRQMSAVVGRGNQAEVTTTCP